MLLTCWDNSDAQYKRFITKYKLEKNVKHDVREWIAAKRRKRSVEGKDTQVFLNGRVVRMERLGAWREEAEEDRKFCRFLLGGLG